jgi:lysozyme
MIDELRELLEADEGSGDHLVYVDHLGKATVGIGHLILDDDEEAGWPVGTPVSEERVTELFDQDVQTSIDDAIALHPYLNDWPIPAQITVISLAFQLGLPRYSKFVKHHEALDRRQWMTAADELRDSKLYRQTPERTERHAQRLESV